MATSPNWAEIWLAAATTGALPIIFVAYRQFRDSARTRHSQLLLDLETRWSAPELTDAQSLIFNVDPEDLLKLARDAYSHPPTDTTEESARDYRAMSDIPDFFEIVGGLWRHETCLPLRAIEIVWADNIPMYWRQWERTIKWLNQEEAARRDLPDERLDQIYENFRKLAEALNALKPRWRDRIAALLKKLAKRISGS